MLRIPYESEDFPTGTVKNGSNYLSATWGDILWAAVTVGRPNRGYVFRHGDASVFEAVFRWSLVRASLEQTSPHALWLKRTVAAKTLDPTEKGAVNYFLGMTFCKLFAAKLLNTPWLLHLDVFRPRLDPVLSGRSRPDLVGHEPISGKWYAFECKGRSGPPDSTTKANSKAQAQRLISVKGDACSLHIGAVSYFRGDTLCFYWRDPPPDYGQVTEVPFDADDWRYYYDPVLEIIRRTDQSILERQQNSLVDVEGADISVGVHPAVSKYLVNGQYQYAQKAAIEAADSLAVGGYQRDGIAVRAGESWSKRFDAPLG